MGSPDASVRRALADELRDSAAPFVGAAFWVLSQDADLQVRQMGLEAVRRRCLQEPVAVCTALLRLYVGDLDEAIAYRARDCWLQLAPHEALADGPLAWRTEVLNRISPQTLGQSALNQLIVRRLSQDDDAQLQDHAAWLLEH